MASRKKALSGPRQMPLEMIRYRDHAGYSREVLDLAVLENIVCGWLWYEDDEQVVLLHEFSDIDNWHKKPIDATSVLKPNIVERRRLVDMVDTNNLAEVTDGGSD